MGCSVRSLQSRFDRAKRNLKTAIEKLEGDPQNRKLQNHRDRKAGEVESLGKKLDAAKKKEAAKKR